MPDQRAGSTPSETTVWPCDRSLCDSPAVYVCRGETDLFRKAHNLDDRPCPVEQVKEYLGEWE